MIYQVENGRSLRAPLKKALSNNLSPDGTRILESEKGGLQIRYLDSGKIISLIKNTDDDSIRNGRAVWSPDGNHIGRDYENWAT